METINVINGVACSMAIIEKESEKAICLTYSADIYGEWFTIKKQWLAKSMIMEYQRKDNKIWFTANNDWILDRKTKDYCKWVAENFSNVCHEIKTYLSNINNLIIVQVFC